MRLPFTAASGSQLIRNCSSFTQCCSQILYPYVLYGECLLLILLTYFFILDAVMRNPSSQTANDKEIDQRPPHLSRAEYFEQRGSCKSLVNS
ncbi:hypothetical protein MHYP_G00361000 [Metynnis hypsauchen]